MFSLKNALFFFLVKRQITYPHWLIKSQRPTLSSFTLKSFLESSQPLRTTTRTSAKSESSLFLCTYLIHLHYVSRTRLVGRCCTAKFSTTCDTQTDSLISGCYRRVMVNFIISFKQTGTVIRKVYFSESYFLFHR